MNNTFMTSERNDVFSQLRGLELQDLLFETSNCMLEYRYLLNLPSDVTFGVEIEYESLYRYKIDQFIETIRGWTSDDDGSLVIGGEVISPILTDKTSDWQNLKKVCEYLSKKNVDTIHNAGGHIHIGAHVLGDDVEAWRTFLKLYIAYENIIFRFAYGDKISGRKNIKKFASPIACVLYNKLDLFNNASSLFGIRLNLPDNKYNALNFKNVDWDDVEFEDYKNTIEFRSPNATTSAVIWQNSINAFAKMILASKDKVINEAFLDYKLKHEYLPYAGNEYMYNNINLKNVLEFIDLVFDNNLDKMYFLRQYIKDFQDNYGLKGAVKAKRFVD